MDCADKDLNKTSNIKREAMVSKLHNMQWLKNTLYSSNPEKAKTTCKQMQDHNENSKTEDKVLLMGNIHAPLVKEPDTCCLIEKYKEHISGDIMSESNKNICNRDTDIPDLFQSIKELIIDKNKEEDIVEDIVTTKLEAEFDREEQSEESADTNTAQNKTDDTVRVATYSSLDKKLEPHKADQDTEKMNFIKHSDDNNNNNSKFTTLSISETDVKEKAVCKAINVESNKPTEAKDNDAQVKTPINESKMSTKNEGDATLSKSNEEPSTSNIDSIKSVSSSSKLTTSAKNTKIDRSNNKHTYARNIAFIRREEFVKQRSLSRDGTENENARSSISKADAETELNKTIDTPPQNKSTNKSKVPQKQTVSKQFVSKTKSQESLKKDTSVSNCNKDNTLEKTETGMHASKSSELTLSGSEKKDQEAMGEKNSRNDQKGNRGVNSRKSATFVAQYRNSTFSKQANGTPNSKRQAEHTSANGRNLLYTRNNPRSNPRERTDNIGRKTVTQRDFTSSNSKFNRRIEESHANNTENHAKRQNEAVASACNHKNDMKPAKTETQLIENKELVNSSSVDHAEQKPITTEQSQERMEATDKSKVDVNQQDVVVTNKTIDKEINTPTYISSSDKCTTESQTDAIHQHSKLENTQRTDNATQLENNQIWYNVPSMIQKKNATSANSQQSVQSIPYSMHQISAQAEDLSRQMSPWAPDQSGKYYEQHFATDDLMRLGHIPNTAFDAVSYENSLQAASSDGNVPPSTLEIAIDRNRENSNASYRYVPHSRPVASFSNFPGYSVSSGYGNRWSSAMQEGGIPVEHPVYNVTQQSAAMQVYKSDTTYGPDDFNAHATNCLPQPIVYTPCMQTWNPQMQYPMPIFYNSPYSGYVMFPDTMNQSSEFDDSGPMHSQQPKYVCQAQMNNYARNARGYDSNVAQARNIVDNGSARSNQYYKRYHDNCRPAYDATMQRYAPPISHPRSQQGMNFVPTSVNMSQRNAQSMIQYAQNPKYRQNMNNTQMLKKPHDQRIQDFVCDDNALEDIPPMISPKEFITSNMNLASKNDQFTMQAFKSEFKMNPSADYRPPLWQRYNSNFRRNATCQDFSRDNGSPVSIGRGTYKNKKP